MYKIRDSQSRLVREDKTCNTMLFSVSMTANPLLVPTANLDQNKRDTATCIHVHVYNTARQCYKQSLAGTHKS